MFLGSANAIKHQPFFHTNGKQLEPYASETYAREDGRVLSPIHGLHRLQNVARENWRLVFLLPVYVADPHSYKSAVLSCAPCSQIYSASEE